jgi:hypothetical protein
VVYAPHTLFVMGGVIADPSGAGEDIWECTIRGVQVDSPDRPVTDPVAFMNGIAAPLLAWFKAPASCNVVAAALGYIKVNNIGADGKYISKTATNVHDYPANQTGGAPATHDFSKSWAYSWSTSVARGPGKNGRIYPPNASVGSAGSAICTSADQAKLLAAAQGLLHVLNVGDGDTAGMLPVVASKVNATNTPITGIRIGRVVDSQRRRVNALAEDYVAGPAFP